MGRYSQIVLEVSNMAVECDDLYIRSKMAATRSPVHIQRQI